MRIEPKGPVLSFLRQGKYCGAFSPNYVMMPSALEDPSMKLRLVTCLASLWLCSILTFAQSSSPQHKKPTPEEVAKLPAFSKTFDHEIFIPYWTAEAGWHTELELRNNLAAKDLSVTPALRTPDGTEIPLAPVVIHSGVVQSINLHDALTTAKPDLMGQPNAYGSVVLRCNSLSMRNLYGSAMIHKDGYPIVFHLDAMNSAPKLIQGSREGIWWLPKDSTKDYLVLTNQSAQPLPVGLSIYDAAGTASNQDLNLGPRQTLRLSVRDLLARTNLTGTYGGIKVATNAGAGLLDTTHILFDELAGFSATMKMFDQMPATAMSERDYAETGIWTIRAPMLALTNPDPSLALPTGTKLEPQLLLRNATGKAAKVQVAFHWRGDAGDGRISIPPLTLAPYETRRIDVKALQDSNVLPVDAHWAQVTVTTDTAPDQVMAIAASFDSTLRYGAQTPFTDQLASHLEGGNWHVDAVHNSLIAAGNGGSKPAQVKLAFFYDQGTKTYEIDKTIAPDDQMWINVGDLIHNQVPDALGHVLPANLTSGAYQLMEMSNPEQNVLYEGKVVTDKTWGHATYGCMVCCGYNGDGGFGLIEDPTWLTVGFTNGVDAWGNNACSGTPTLLDNYFGTWSSFNSSIVAVTPHNAKGVAPGYTSIRASALRLPSGDGQDQRQPCPMAPANTMGAANVCPTTISIADKIPGSLYNDDPPYRTGVGILTRMQGRTTGCGLHQRYSD